MNSTMPEGCSIRELAVACRDAGAVVAALPTAVKQDVLAAMAEGLESRSKEIIAANAMDLDAARAKGQGAALIDRLRLDSSRLSSVAAGIRAIAAQRDPVGRVTQRETRPNGIRVERVRIPLGLIAMIYEARPNVTADAAALCFYAGNSVLLRGGSEALRSNRAIASVLRDALHAHCLPVAAITLVEDLSRETMLQLLQLHDLIDLAIPRGGEGLIGFVAEHARVPVIKHYRGVCHLYVDRAADLDVALHLLLDGKTTRPAVCNALETLLVHADVAAQFLPRAAAALRMRAVDLRGCDRSRSIVADMSAASDADFAAEFLDLIIAVRVVDDIDGAIAHIRRFGSDHTEVIASGDESAAAHFVGALRSAVMMVNASSRFSDGGELGLGAEIGISTTRLHAYGPMGAEALTIERYVIHGDGQVRHGESAG